MLAIIWNAIVDNIPWWGYVLAGLAALAFAYPYLAPVWALLPKPVKIVIGAVVAGFLAYIAGRNRGAANARLADKEKRDNAIRNRLEVADKVSKMTPTQVDAELDKKGDFID